MGHRLGWFPIYMDPDRVGTWNKEKSLFEKYIVSNLYGSRQSRDVITDLTVLETAEAFPIYMDPDRVGTQCAVGCPPPSFLFPIYMDPDRVGTTLLTSPAGVC